VLQNMKKSLYYATDKQMITRVLRWLNKAAAKYRKLIETIDEREVLWAWDDLEKKDPRVRIVSLVHNLHNINDPGPRRFRRFYQLALERVNYDLRQCWMFPQLKGMGKRPHTLDWFGAPGRHGEKERAYREMVAVILSLHERQLLSGVRECRCGEWFHAEHGKQIFHSDLCRNRMHYANLPPKSKSHRKAGARKYMRRYRALERAKELRAKARILEARGKTQEAADLTTKALELEAKANALARRVKSGSGPERTDK